eukprot:10981_1
MALQGADDLEKLKSLSSKTYKEQSVWFLNALWATQESEAENMWKFCNEMTELDPKGAAGCELEELTAHRFLEKQAETLTVREMRTVLRDIDLDCNHNVSLTEYLVFRYKADWHKLVNSAQSDSDEVQKAQELLADAQRKLSVARKDAEKARKAEAAQLSAENELRAALAELQAQENAFLNKKAQLERASQTGSVMRMSLAKQELDIHMSADPLPLRRAKINQGAAVRKAERATAKAHELRLSAEKSLGEAEAAFETAEEYLNDVKSRAGSGQGALWFVERELYEAKKYLPQAKGGIAKKK